MERTPTLALGQRTHDGISVVRRDPIVDVTIDRPKIRNALDLATWRSLAAIFEELGSESTEIVVVLRGSGRHFSVGSDITQFPAHRTGLASATHYNAAIADALTAVGSIAHPVVAAIRGMAVGGGLELACAADVRVAADDARFGVPIARLGVSVGFVEAQTLLRVLTPGRLKALLLTARLMTAVEAREAGLVDVLVAAADFESAVADVANTIARGAPLSARANKLTVNAVADGSYEQVASRVAELTEAIYEGPDLQEGIRAFVEKRKPQFRPHSHGDED